MTCSSEALLQDSRERIGGDNPGRVGSVNLIPRRSSLAAPGGGQSEDQEQDT